MADNQGPQLPEGHLGADIMGPMEDTSSENAEAGLTELDHLNLSVFGNDLIFRNIAKFLSYEELKYVRLQNKVMNENVLRWSGFLKKTRFVVKWRTLRDKVLNTLSFPVYCLDLHVFRGAPNEDAVSSARIAVYDYWTRQRDFYITWFQIWEENSEVLKDLYNICRDVRKLRIFGVMSINASFGGIENKMKFFPSVPQVLASAAELKELHIMGNFDVKGLFGHKVDTYEQEQFLKHLESTRTFKFKGHNTVLPDWISGMKNLTSISITTSNFDDKHFMIEEDCTVVTAVRPGINYTDFGYCTFIFDMFYKLSSLAIASKNSLRQLHLDPTTMTQRLVNNSIMYDIWMTEFPALTHFSLAFATEIHRTECGFLLRLLSQLDSLTLSQRLTTNEKQNVPFFPMEFFCFIHQHYQLRELQLATRAPETIQKMCIMHAHFDTHFAHLENLRFFPQLKVLKLGFVAYPFDMSTIFKYLPNSIEELYVSSYHEDDAKPTSCHRPDGSPLPKIRMFPNMKIVQLGDFIIDQDASTYNYLTFHELAQIEEAVEMEGEEALMEGEEALMEGEEAQMDPEQVQVN